MKTLGGDTIVVGVDGSEDGLRAVQYAALLVREHDLSLRIVHVVNEIGVYGPMMPYVPDESFQEIGEGIVKDALRFAVSLQVSPDRVTTRLVHGGRAIRLTEDVDQVRCLVLGTRGSALEHLFTGSTTTAVLARASLPVITVPAAWDPEKPARRRVVVGADGSEVTEHVLAAAFAEASDRGAELQVVHAWRPASSYEGAVEAQTREDWEQAMTAALTKSVDAVATDFPEVRWTVSVQFQRAALALQEAAARADLLVVGRRGHHAVASLFVGSLARTMVRTATTPVLVVPVGEHDAHGE